jgi:RNA polymerase sigma factor (sigma-70 family)
MLVSQRSIARCARQQGNIALVARNEERYLLQALEFEGMLRAHLSRLTQNNSDVDELLQEVYARLLTAGGTNQPEVRSVRTFALTLARNVALERLRDHPAAPIEAVADMEPLEPADERDPVEEIAGSPAELAILLQAIQGLPDRCRQVFTLRKVYGYSQKEIALRLDLPENTVEQHLTNAARRCAQALFERPVPERRLPLFDRFRERKRENAQGE